jgi:hypothetical protein
MTEEPMNPIFSQTTSKLDPSVGAMTTGNELFLRSRAANPGFFLPIEDAPETAVPLTDASVEAASVQATPSAMVQIGLEQLSYGGSLSPLMQITLISCAEDLRKLSTD